MGDELKHYGILGMKWGVRRSPFQLGRKPTSDSEQGNARGSTKGGRGLKGASNSRKSASSLTDDELRSRLNRLKMEDEYARLLDQQHARSISRGRKLLNDALGSLGKQVLDKSTTKLANKLFETKNEKSDIQQLSDAVKRLTLEAKYEELTKSKTRG